MAEKALSVAVYKFVKIFLWICGIYFWMYDMFFKNFTFIFVSAFLIINFYGLTAQESCFVISDLEPDKIIEQVGDCETQETPCSTFKIALSLMGFDAGILINENEPVISLVPGVDKMPELQVWCEPHDPQLWIKNSCVWYSQKITQKLGFEELKKYVSDFAYGNQDFFGDQGKNNGLEKSWLCSSLKISPLQQIDFLRKFLQFKLPVSSKACELTKNILFVCGLTDGWKLYGKTGSGFWVDENNVISKSIGWFVGWVSKGKKTLIFACLVKGGSGESAVNGKGAREIAFDKLKNYIY